MLMSVEVFIILERNIDYTVFFLQTSKNPCDTAHGYIKNIMWKHLLCLYISLPISTTKQNKLLFNSHKPEFGT